MKIISIFNDVLGPIMRGPSSSHTAGPYQISCLARQLLGEKPAEVGFIFDKNGSFAEVYKLQGSDLGFAAGLTEMPLTDPLFSDALRVAGDMGIHISFSIEDLKNADHPNLVEILITGISGKSLHLRAVSLGGGSVRISHLNHFSVDLNGQSNAVFLQVNQHTEEDFRQILEGWPHLLFPVKTEKGKGFLEAHYSEPIPDSIKNRLIGSQNLLDLWQCEAQFYVKKGEPLFSSVQEMSDLAEKNKKSLGEIVLDYEACLLGLSSQEICEETIKRFRIMESAVEQGLFEKTDPFLVEPSAGDIFSAEESKRLPFGGLHTRAAARAMAVMHVNSSFGVVCAAPTAGSAGVIPAVMVTLKEYLNLKDEEIALSLLAASGIGLVLAQLASFAAEESGCQVEIGAAGAMAAAAVIEAVGGSLKQAFNAAAISFQNTMGWTCDPVQGFVEIPCHTRNAVAASNAFLAADLIQGGYINPIPLDETIQAVAQVGQLMPREIKCTALGGLALTPSGKNLPCRKKIT